eukprot:CAMPEP_0171452226 /NCGR_PEP_ID=MMETSP0945-20130129/415_1 /TAXON_ID=109269 /ORGANISM="Vaucheria litorea, Strain CCMP2940" /LENGTH=512 /DNA_ID=CAMNT_0011976843 /DNA_START=64 /DNA_END=1599 /DNA_ORIENTATION=-
MGNSKSTTQEVDFVMMEGKNEYLALNYGTEGQESLHQTLRNDDEDEDFEVTPSQKTLVYVCAICSSLTSVLLGYDVGVMSGAILYIGEDLNMTTVQKEMVVGSLNVIAAFGGLIAGKVSDKLGRRPAIALSCIIFMSGALMSSLANTFNILLIGRIITGVGCGCGFVVSPVYITEITPPAIRGRLVSLTDICINLGILLGYMTSFACESLIPNDDLKWRAMLGLGIMPPVLILICLIGLPESPRWLIGKGKIKEGKEVLEKVLSTQEEVDETLKMIQKAVNDREHLSEPGWMEVLWPSDNVIKAAAFVGLGLGFWQQATGSEAAVYYSPTVLADAGITSRGALLLGTCLVGCFKLGGELIAMSLLDSIGRKPLFITSAVLSTISLALLGLALLLQWPAMPTLATLCMFMASFSIGIGPLTFVVAAEVFPLHIRGQAVSIVVFVNRFLSGAIALSYLSIAEALTPAGSFFAFAIISAISIFFYALCVPETKGKTLEQIAHDLASEFKLPDPDW